MKRFWILLLSMMLLATSALAETATLDGSVIATQEAAVLAPAAGVIGNVGVQSGQRVAAGEEIASFDPQPIYAEQSGTARLFGSEGEAVETVSARYGAVLYIEPDYQYTVSASTRNAYSAIETKIVHPGETVYLQSADGEYKGVGFIASVSGSDFSVEVTEGVFENNSGVSIFRGETRAAKTRVGKGTISKVDPVAYSGTGAICAVHVENGAHVQQGSLLYETLETSAYGHRMTAPVSGAVAAVSVSAGDTVEQGALIATLYPDTAMRLKADAEELDLRAVKVGGPVEITFANGMTAQGVVERIAATAEAEADEEADDEDTVAHFAVYIAFDAPDTVSYGMTAKVAFTAD